MSMDRCEKHDTIRDTDWVVECPKCEEEEADREAEFWEKLPEMDARAARCAEATIPGWQLRLLIERCLYGH